MTNANTLIYDKSVDRAAMVRLYEQKVNSKVELVIDGHAIRVDTLIKKSKLNGTGFKGFQHDLEDEIIKTMQETRNITSRSLVDLFKDQVSYTVQNLDSAIGKLWRTEQPPRRIAEDFVLKQPLIGNQTLDAGWSHIGLSEKLRIETIIRKGVAEGLTEDAIAKEVSASAFNITKNQARGLVVTSITSIYTQADHEVYKANEKALQGWQYVAVLDSRTTPLCAHRDGTIYPISDTEHLPPAHWHCRSTTIPIVKSYEQLAELEGISQIRKRNLSGLTPKQIAFYDGQSPLKESYNEWLLRQPQEVQYRHLGSTAKLEAFRSGQLTLDKFTNPDGSSIGIKELRSITDSGYGVPGDTRRFALAKEKLDTIKLGAARPDDFYSDTSLQNSLREYYQLQAGELDGTLSLTNYRGTLLYNKKNTKARVLSTPPTEDNMKFNPITGRYEDTRMYQPNPAVLDNAYRLVQDSDKLLKRDKEFIVKFVDSLENTMGVNERAVITENLRITFGRYRDNVEPWANLKAVLQGQIKFDVMNVSDYIETQIRKDSNLLAKLKQDNYIDPVLGPVQLQDLHDNFHANIYAKNKWEDTVAPRIANELRGILDYKIPVKLKRRLGEPDLHQFYLRFANRLSLADNPDRDQLAISLGRDLYNMASYRGSRNEWYKLGVKLLDDAKDKGFYSLETFGVQKRRMKSRNFGAYFGPYYDTFSVNLRITDPRIQEYARLTRKVEVGLRVGVTTPKNKLLIREGYKTYHIDQGIKGLYDTRIPITSTSSFSDFPAAVIDKNLTNALNWMADAKYKVDTDFYDFIQNLLNFQDDKGKADYYNSLNQYKEYIIERGDAYERFKAMEWLRRKDAAFSNHPFLDHRARIYERGLIGPQSGETFRPFLNTAESKNFSAIGYKNLLDQVGGFLGGASDKLEGRYNSLSVLGRNQIAVTWRDELIKIGNMMRRGKPNDIRKILESKLLAEIDGEEQGKAFRFALELAKIDEFLGGDYSAKSLERLSEYKIAVALEQDASSSGAQIIALTTKNKQLAELTNVIPTNQKKRLYDEIARETFNDPRFRKLNVKLGLTEKDLRKASKAQNMVTFYGAGERTGILNVERKLASALASDDVLVIKAAERDAVLSQISARMARYEKFDPDMYDQLKALRQDVKDIFNKGLQPGDDILEELFFLDAKTRDVVEKLSRTYEKTVTPDDFKEIAMIMSENLRVQVPILKDFTKFFGRLADDFVTHAKPSQPLSDALLEKLKLIILGKPKEAFDINLIDLIPGLKDASKIPAAILENFKFSSKSAKSIPNKLKEEIKLAAGIDDRNLLKELVNRIPGYKPNSFLSEILFGARKLELPKKWTSVPWVNFDKVTLEQNFTQTFEERLAYQDADGKWINNIIQVPQKTDPTPWEEFLGKDGKINDIVDANKARTAFAVNGNHSNDAVIVKRFLLWGKTNNIQTSTIHDAFYTNAADMLKARSALRNIYSEIVQNSSILDTLNEMYDRGLPKELYTKYLNEAIDIGLIPVVGRSKIDGKLVKLSDILTKEDILAQVSEKFDKNYHWYGVE
jgi:SPP1 gp7 family putative phage head morphogenesis protein